MVAVQRWRRSVLLPLARNGTVRFLLFQAQMKVRLISLTPRVSKLRITLGRLPAVLGRNPDADVRLDDHWVSRVHCELSEISSILVVRDLDSRNGTLVNGQYIREAHLMPGNRLTVGLTSFQVRYRRDPKRPFACAAVSPR